MHRSGIPNCACSVPCFLENCKGNQIFFRERTAQAEALAEQCRIEAEGKAKAIFAKLKAEARGNYKILAKTLPPMMQVMKEVGGIEFPETLATIAGVEKKEKAEPQS